MTALRSHDRVSRIEDQRSSSGGGGTGGKYKSYHNAFNLLPNVNFDGDGCRCCYDPNGDGGEYELLARARGDRDVGAAADGRRDEDGDARRAVFGAEDDEGEDHRAEKRRDETDSTDDTDDDDDDSEFDYLLDEEEDGPADGGGRGDADDARGGPMARRRAELEDSARRREAARCHGYGVHRQMAPARAFAAAGYRGVLSSRRDDARPPPRGSVLHLYDPGSLLSASLDLCLEGVSSRHPGTKFVRGHGIASIPHAAAAGGGGGGGGDDGWRRADLPILLALRDGEVVAWSSGLRDFRDDDGGGAGGGVISDAVENWLDMAGALIDEVPHPDLLCGIRPEEEALLDDMRRLIGTNAVGRGRTTRVGGDDDEDDHRDHHRYDCGVAGCDKSFYHEHVGIRTEAQDGLLVSESQVASSSADSVS